MKYNYSRLKHEDRKPILVHKTTHKIISDLADDANLTMQTMTQELIEKGYTQLRAEDYRKEGL